MNNQDSTVFLLFAKDNSCTNISTIGLHKLSIEGKYDLFLECAINVNLADTTLRYIFRFEGRKIFTVSIIICMEQ